MDRHQTSPRLARGRGARARVRLKHRACSTYLILLLLAGGCEDPGPEEAMGGSPRIDPMLIDPGDQVSGMRVEAIEARPETIDSAGWAGRVDFSGPITLTGRYMPLPDSPEPAPLCFYPDSSSAAELPRFANDRRVSWFCFTNDEEARGALGAPEGTATIVINEFHYLYEHTDSHNTARLQQVHQRR